SRIFGSGSENSPISRRKYSSAVDSLSCLSVGSMILYTPVSRADNSMNTVRLFIVIPRALDEASLPDEKWSRRQPGSMGKVSGRPNTRIGILIPGRGERAKAGE